MAALAVTVLVVHWNRAYTSDDVGQQLILRTFHLGGRAYVGEDTFVLHLPVYWLAHLLLGSTRQAVLAEALVLDLVALGLVALAAARFVRLVGGDRSATRLAVVLGVTSFASFGGIVGDLLARPNFRTVDVAAGLLLAAEVVAVGAGVPTSRRRLAMLVAGLGLVALDDPYALWAVVLPAVAAGVVLRPSVGAGRTRWRTAVAVVVAGGVAFELLALGLAAIGMRSTTAGIELTPVHEVGPALRATVSALRDYVHDAVGLPDGANWLRASARIAIVGVGVALLTWSAASARGERRLLGVLVALPLAAVAVYAVTDPTGRPGTERYLFAAVPAFAVVLAVGLALAPPAARRVGVAVLVAAIGANVLLTAGVAAQGRQLQDDQATLVRELRDLEVPRGYADFWAANILSYRSDLALDVLPVECRRSRTVRRTVIVDASRFDRHAARSFVLLGPAGATCTEAEVVDQLGAPARVVDLSFGFRALVYGRDVGRRIHA